MSDLPNVYYKKTDTVEELQKIIQHLQDRVQKLSTDLEMSTKTNDSLLRANTKLHAEISSHYVDEDKLEQAKKLRELVGVLKAMWEEV